MQTIKGLIALLLTAAVVFTVVATNDIKSQERYAAKLFKPAAVETAGIAKAGEMIPNTAGKIANTTTNAADQARRKTPRT